MSRPESTVQTSFDITTCQEVTDDMEHWLGGGLGLSSVTPEDGLRFRNTHSLDWLRMNLIRDKDSDLADTIQIIKDIDKKYLGVMGRFERYRQYQSAIEHLVGASVAVQELRLPASDLDTRSGHIALLRNADFARQAGSVTEIIRNLPVSTFMLLEPTRTRESDDTAQRKKYLATLGGIGVGQDLRPEPIFVDANGWEGTLPEGYQRPTGGILIEARF